MGIQDVKKAIVAPLFTGDPLEDLKRFQKAYSELSQQVRDVHNRIQQFGVAIAGGATTLAVTMPHPTFTTAYGVFVDFIFSAGSRWVTAKTKTGFTLNWASAAVGAQTARLLIVE